MERHPFLLPADEVAQQLGTDTENGLTTARVAELHKVCPPNQLDVAGGVKWYRVLSRQLVHPMNLVSELAGHDIRILLTSRRFY
jgi:P-type Na+/K+ transporter